MTSRGRQDEQPEPEIDERANVAPDVAETAEANALRGRAERCRRSARLYVSKAGSSLEELAIELDEAADLIDAKAAGRGASSDPDR